MWLLGGIGNPIEQIQIFNAMGMLMKEISLTQPMANKTMQIDITDFPGGLYFVHMKNHPLQTLKFIKQQTKGINKRNLKL